MKTKTRFHELSTLFITTSLQLALYLIVYYYHSHTTYGNDNGNYDGSDDGNYDGNYDGSDDGSDDGNYDGSDDGNYDGRTMHVR